MEGLALWIASETITNCHEEHGVSFGLISRQADPTDEQGLLALIEQKIASVVGDDFKSVWLASSWGNDVPQNATLTLMGSNASAVGLALEPLLDQMLGASRLGGSFATSRTRTLKSWNGATDEAILLAALTKAIQQSAGPLAGTNDVPDARSKTSKATPPPGALSIDQVLVEVRSKYRRATPLEAQAAAFPPTPHPEGPLAVLIDIRPDWQRLEEGEIPGALIVGRNVLEWRLDPQSDSRLLKPEGIAERYDNRLIIFCSEGYASTLTIPTLLTLGLHRATDIEGGFQAWKAAGLPTTGGSA